jgi:hypothetical protein
MPPQARKASGGGVYITDSAGINPSRLGGALLTVANTIVARNTNGDFENAGSILALHPAARIRPRER